MLNINTISSLVSGNRGEGVCIITKHNWLDALPFRNPLGAISSGIHLKPYNTIKQCYSNKFKKKHIYKGKILLKGLEFLSLDF